MPRYGDPDGHGRYAILDFDDAGMIVCHECGAAFNQLATHVRLTHGITATEYRVTHGLGAATRLASRLIRDKMREAWGANAETHLADLAAHRDPDKAQLKSRETPWAPETRARRALVRKANAGRDLTATEVDLLGDPLDIASWAAKARALLEDRTVSAASLARTADISPSTVQQRLRRYPSK